VTRPPSPVVAGSIGIMGGTFDPIHLGHLAIAEEAREALGLERILFIPASIPPHKRAAPTPAADRVAMVEAAIAGNEQFVLSRIEVDRSGRSFTVETVELLAAAERDAGRTPDLTFVMSAETLSELPGWHEPRRLLASCRVAVVPRAGYPPPERAWLDEAFPGLADRFILLEGPRLGVSSTTIRERVALGRSIRYLVPPEVAQIIATRHLYREPGRQTSS
jgi:nicotinate-nucleotide adenylyltransferase